MNVYPKQATSITEKQSEAWQRANIDYWIAQSNFAGAPYTEMARLYRAADGYINLADYNYILNPYGVEDERLKAFPAKLRNMDIIQPIIDAFLGEQSKKPTNAQVIVVDESVETAYKASLEDKLMGILAQSTINELNNQGMQTGVDSKPTPDVAQAAAKHKDEWSDIRAIDGQAVLDYILAFNDFDEIKQRLLKDYYSVGRVFTYKDVRFDDVKYEAVSPLDFWCLKSSNSPFVEDSVAQVHRPFMLINDIIDRWRDKLTDAQVKMLDDEVNVINQPSNPSGYALINSERMDSVSTYYGRYTGGRIEVYHVCWKTLRKVGILSYTNELGQQQETEVDETYKLNKEAGDIDIEWGWVSEGWEQRRIGNNIYLPAEKIWVERTDSNNISDLKLPYNGRIEGTISGEITSVVKRGLVYQALYNIYHYRREMTINRNKDKILMFPIGLIPSKFGKDPMDRFMHYLEANSLGFFDETKPNAAAAMQALKSIDMGLYQYIAGMTDVLKSVKEEWWEAIGMNRQRYGDVLASDGKGVTEQAIFRSSVLSAERNRKFNKLLEKDYQGLLDCSKYAFINGKKANFITPDRRQVMFSIDPEVHCNTSYGLFAVDSDEEHDNLKMMKDYAFAMVQKGEGKASMVADIVEGKNFAKLKDLIKKAEALQDSVEQERFDAEQKTAKYTVDVQADTAEKDRDIKKYVADKNYDAAVDAASIAADVKIATDHEDTDSGTGIEGLSVEREKIQTDAQLKREDIGERRNNNRDKITIEQKKLYLEAEKIKSGERIAKIAASAAKKRAAK